MAPPLATLTDRDLLLNLWLTVMLLTDEIDVGPDECEQPLLRDGQSPDPNSPLVTLAQLITETASRLRLTGDMDGFKQELTN